MGRICHTDIMSQLQETQVLSGVDETSTRKVKGPDTSLYEQESANFVSKSKDGKGIPIPKKRQLKIYTSFLSKKPKQQHRLGSYPITAKYSRSSKETSAKSTSQCDPRNQDSFTPETNGE